MTNRVAVIVWSLCSLLLVGGCSGRKARPPQTYSKNGVTFKYPAGWVIIQPRRLAVVVTDSRPLAIVADKAEKNTALVTVRRVLTKRSMTEYVQSLRQIAERGKRKLRSYRNLTVGGYPATEMVRTMYRLSGKAVIQRTIYFGVEKRFYSINCGADVKRYESLKASFDLIVRTLKVKEGA